MAARAPMGLHASHPVRTLTHHGNEPDAISWQAVLLATLDTLLLSLAPVLPFLAEEVHAHRTADPAAGPVWSPFTRQWAAPPDSWHDPPLARRWRLALGAKAEVVRLHHQVSQ
jgi:isoleucyl-tRNA synthetase